MTPTQCRTTGYGLQSLDGARSQGLPWGCSKSAGHGGECDFRSDSAAEWQRQLLSGHPATRFCFRLDEARDVTCGGCGATLTLDLVPPATLRHPSGTPCPEVDLPLRDKLRTDSRGMLRGRLMLDTELLAQFFGHARRP